MLFKSLKKSLFITTICLLSLGGFLSYQSLSKAFKPIEITYSIAPVERAIENISRFKKIDTIFAFQNKSDQFKRENIKVEVKTQAPSFLALYNRIQLPHEKNKILITRNEKDQNFDRISTLKAALEKSNEKSVTPSLLDNNYTPFEVSDYSKLFLDKKPKLSEKRLTRIPIFVESSKPVEPIIRVGENKTVLSSNKKDRDMSVKAEELFKPWKPTSIVQNNKLRKVSTQKKSTAEKKVSTQKVSGSDKVNTRQAKSIIVDPLAFQNELLTKNTEKDLKQNKSNDAQAAQTNIQNIKNNIIKTY
jgi:hypothetical protein